jgi:predicted nucleic acid-binding Zn ribbon protein
LEVLVAHSALLQELSFRKEELLEALRRQIPEEPVREIRFRLGSVDG